VPVAPAAPWRQVAGLAAAAWERRTSALGQTAGLGAPGQVSGGADVAGRPGPTLYLILTFIPRRTTVVVGRKGAYEFPRGWYVYVGSAIRARDARVARHLALEKRLRWHADYLFTAVPARAAWLVDGARGECELAGALANLPGAERRPSRFGAGDCRCPGHLVRSPRRPLRRDLAAAAQAAGAPLSGSLSRYRRPI
jgi:Uri superfamily endonuclease